MLRRTTGILHRTSTVLNGVLNYGFNLLGGACHGGNHGHASLRLPGNGGGSLHGHRNGACDAPAIGAVKSLLSTLPPATPNGWHSVLASRSGTAREYALRGCESSLGARSLNGLENGLKESPPEAVSFAGECVFQATAERTTSGLSYSCGVAALFTGVKAETTETRFPDLEAASGRHHLGPFLYNDCAVQSAETTIWTLSLEKGNARYLDLLVASSTGLEASRIMPIHISPSFDSSAM